MTLKESRLRCGPSMVRCPEKTRVCPAETDQADYYEELARFSFALGDHLILERNSRFSLT